MSGRPAPVAACLLALAALPAVPAPTWALGDTEVTADQGVAAGGSITGSTITVGMPPAQVQALVAAFTQQLGVETGARAEAEAQAARFATQLGFTREAVIAFFRVLGEREVPLERMPTKLGEIAQRYQELLARLMTTSSIDPEVQQLKEEARAALDAGDFARTEELLNQAKTRDLAAIEQMRAAMERVQADLDARQLSAAEAAAGNGELMMTRIRYADAARYHVEAVGLTPEKHAEQLSEHLADLSEAAWRAGDYQPALDAVRRALALNEARLPADDARLGTSLNNLALLYQDAGRYGEAEPLYRRALAIYERALGPDHPEVAIVLNNLALLYHDTGRWAEAEPLYRRAIAIGEKTLGPEHPDLAKGLNNLAELYRATGRYGEAEPLYARALAIDEKVYGPDHPELATDLNNLALLYQATGRYDQAEPLFQRAVAILEESLPPGHPHLMMGLENHAGLLEELGRQAEAAALRARAEAIRQRRERPPSPPSP